MHYSMGQFVREDVGSIKEGRAVIYTCHGIPFQIVATRRGVAVKGELPFLPAAGAEAIIRILWRAIRHHQNLNTPVGEVQTPLSESVVEAEEHAFFDAAAMAGAIPPAGAGSPH
jgi:hypothetical protein